MSLSELKNDLNNREVEDVETILFVHGLTLFSAEDFRRHDLLRGRFERDDFFCLCRVAVLGAFVSCNLWYRRWIGLVRYAISQGEEVKNAYGRLCSVVKKNYGRELRQDEMQESCGIDAGTIGGIANWLLSELLGEHLSENVAELRDRVEGRLMALTRDDPINDYLIDLDNAKERIEERFWPISYKDYMMQEIEKKLFGNRKLT